MERGDAAVGLLVPVAEQRRVPIHKDVPEVLDDGREIDPEHAVILELRGLQVVLDGPAAAQESNTRHIHMEEQGHDISTPVSMPTAGKSRARKIAPTMAKRCAPKSVGPK